MKRSLYYRTKMAIVGLLWNFTSYNLSVRANNVDALQGSSPTSTPAPAASEVIPQTTQTVVTESSDAAADFVRNIQQHIGPAQRSDVLEEVNRAVNTSRQESWGMAQAFASPIGYVLMFLANILWYLMSFLYFFQTTLDIYRLNFMSPESIMAIRDNEEDGLIKRMLKSFFFWPSADLKQTLIAAGLAGPQGQSQAQPQVQSTQGSAIPANNGSQPAGNKPSRKNLLGMYAEQRFKTFIFLGITIAVALSGQLFEIQGDLVAIVIALFNAVWNPLKGIFGL